MGQTAVMKIDDWCSHVRGLLTQSVHPFISIRDSLMQLCKRQISPGLSHASTYADASTHSTLWFACIVSPLSDCVMHTVHSCNSKSLPPQLAVRSLCFQKNKFLSHAELPGPQRRHHGAGLQAWHARPVQLRSGPHSQDLERR